MSEKGKPRRGLHVAGQPLLRPHPPTPPPTQPLTLASQLCLKSYSTPYPPGNASDLLLTAYASVIADSHRWRTEALSSGHFSDQATTRRWAVSSGIWGASAGIAALLVRLPQSAGQIIATHTQWLQILSVTPIVKKNVLVKVPVVCVSFPRTAVPFNPFFPRWLVCVN